MGWGQGISAQGVRYGDFNMLNKIAGFAGKKAFAHGCEQG